LSVILFPQDTIIFVELVSSALPIICELLRSRQVTDVIQAIEFFTSAFQFGMAGAIIGVQQMLVLMWSHVEVVRDAVAVAYRRLYLTTENTTPRYVYNLVHCTDRLLSVKLILSELNELCSAMRTHLHIEIHCHSKYYLNY
jgi:condensin complex subunit 1